jgi:hypothetical protein
VQLAERKFTEPGDGAAGNDGMAAVGHFSPSRLPGVSDCLGWIPDIPFAARKCMVAPSSRRSGLVSYRCTQLKCGRMDTPRNLQTGAFAGTAEAYFRYRPPYPKALLASLVT